MPFEHPKWWVYQWPHMAVAPQKATTATHHPPRTPHSHGQLNRNFNSVLSSERIPIVGGTRPIFEDRDGIAGEFRFSKEFCS